MIKWILTVKLQPVDVNSLEKYGFFKKCIKVSGLNRLMRVFLILRMKHNSDQQVVLCGQNISDRIEYNCAYLSSANHFQPKKN